MSRLWGTNDEERDFLAFIRAHKAIGYGRMMQIISHQWWREGGPVAHAANTSFAALPERERAAHEHVALNDPAFRDEATTPPSARDTPA